MWNIVWDNHLMEMGEQSGLEKGVEQTLGSIRGCGDKLGKIQHTWLGAHLISLLMASNCS